MDLSTTQASDLHAIFLPREGYPDDLIELRIPSSGEYSRLTELYNDLDFVSPIPFTDWMLLQLILRVNDVEVEDFSFAGFDSLERALIRKGTNALLSKIESKKVCVVCGETCKSMICRGCAEDGWEQHATHDNFFNITLRLNSHKWACRNGVVAHIGDNGIVHEPLDTLRA